MEGGAVILLWLGCRDMTDAEIGTFLDVNTRAVNAVQASADQIETLQRHGKGDGDYSYDGTLESTAYDGTIDVVGTGSSAQGGTVLAWSLDLVYNDVSLEDITMNGPVHTTISIGIDNGQVTVGHVVRGPLEVEGAITGTADCAYSMSASSSHTAAYSGTVNGIDVAGI
jgi:hypothetical protein